MMGGHRRCPHQGAPVFFLITAGLVVGDTVYRPLGNHLARGQRLCRGCAEEDGASQVFRREEIED